MKVAFYGPMCAGKTYCADYLLNKFGSSYAKVNFAKRLKEIANELFGVSGKDGNDRIVLQQLGQKMREIQDDVWINTALREVAAIEKRSGWNVVIDDLRYLNEAAALRNNGFVLVRVYAPEFIRLSRINKLYPNTPAESSKHSSELEWQQIVPDFEINNEGVDTYAQLEKIVGQTFGAFPEGKIHAKS